ncbi:MAG: N-acetylneuraminate synthase family protein [Candidatus Omnitrophota bacterium]
MDPFAISGKTIGEDQPCFIVAEGGLNHNGDPDLAVRLIEVASAVGADAIKFQTYTPHELFPPDHPEFAKFQKTVFDKKTYLRLQDTAKSKKIILLSTPFDEASADLLDEIGVPAFKIGSGEVTHLNLLRHIAAKGKPIILSTGMSTLNELDAAIAALCETGEAPLCLLHCVSSYPCPLEKANVRAIETLRERYGRLVGYSDHTTSDLAALAAISLKACIIEKHFTLSHHLPGWDHFFSYDPHQFEHFIHSIRQLESALGGKEKKVFDHEEPIRAIARRAIYARVPLKAGQAISRESVIVRRPEGPLSADALDWILGKTLLHDVAEGAPLRREDLRSD